MLRAPRFTDRRQNGVLRSWGRKQLLSVSCTPACSISNSVSHDTSKSYAPRDGTDLLAVAFCTSAYTLGFLWGHSLHETQRWSAGTWGDQLWSQRWWGPQTLQRSMCTACLLIRVLGVVYKSPPPTPLQTHWPQCSAAHSSHLSVLTLTSSSAWRVPFWGALSSLQSFLNGLPFSSWTTIFKPEPSDRWFHSVSLLSLKFIFSWYHHRHLAHWDVTHPICAFPP